MSNAILKNIFELEKDNVITQEIGNKIRQYYREKEKNPQNKLFIVFSIFGAILVGLGIVLIIAHNWDNLSRTLKTILAFLPLFSGQLLCGFVLLKKQHSLAWKESTTTFLFFSIGACISLIHQIYNLPTNKLSTFILTWMLLSLPLIYVMLSSMVSLFYIIGITYYAGEISYWSFPTPISESYLYWLLLLGILPYYFFLYKRKPESNFMTFHNWLIPLTLIITLGTIANKMDEIMFIAYFSLFGLFIMIGNTSFCNNKAQKRNGYKSLGTLATLILLFFLSFDNNFWNKLIKMNFLVNELILSPEFFASVLLTISAGVLLYKKNTQNHFHIHPIELVFILFILIFISGLFSTVLPLIFINVIVFFIGIYTIKEGANKDHLGILNSGLLIIATLVICRFFDTDLSFVTRGILFIAVGLGFFITNYWMLKRRKSNAINK